MHETVPARTEANCPLCVDLDGTLVLSDTFVENLFLFLRRHPFRMPLIALWLLRGKPYLKMKLAEAVPLPVETLPYNHELLAHIRTQRKAGVKVVLATGADRAIALSVASHLGLFDEVWASDGRLNLVGDRKARLLTEKYTQFEYVGNSGTDLPVWLRSQGAIVISSSPKLVKVLERNSIPVRSMALGRKSRISALLQAIRMHQWVKNLLIFFPMLTGHRLTDLPVLGVVGIGFFAFSFSASGTYLINDLFDLQSDRAHPRKRQRPFAAGVLNPFTGIFAAAALFLAAFALSLELPVTARLLLVGYVALTLSYSLRLKRFLVLDVLLLVCFYLIRIFFGGEAAGISVSVWLLAFSMFFFLALALIKRLTELRVLERGAGDNWETSSRGYSVSDTQLLASLAGSSAYLSVILLALYINSPDVHLLYRHPQFLWALCLVILYWLTRMVLIANRGQLRDDPIVFAARDHASWAVAGAATILLFVAS